MQCPEKMRLGERGLLSEDHEGTGRLRALFSVSSQYRCAGPREVEQLNQLLLYWGKLKNADPHLLSLLSKSRCIGDS